MRRLCAVAAVLVAVASASAAVLTDAAGVVLVNGRETRVDRRGLTLARGDRVETVNGSATVRSTAGDDIRLDPSTRLRFEGLDGRTELWFLAGGAAEGKLGRDTALGAGAGWATAPTGGSARVRVRALGGESGDATYTCLEGAAWVRYHGVSVWIPARASVTLRPGAGGAGSLGFEVPAGAATVELVRTVGDGNIAVLAPAGVSGLLGDAPAGRAARVTCVAAPSGALLRIEERRGASAGKRLAELGTGAALDLDGRGGVRLLLPGVGKDVLPGLLAQKEEFAAPK